jgi:hypothetical protein
MCGLAKRIEKRRRRRRGMAGAKRKIKMARIHFLLIPTYSLTSTHLFYTPPPPPY